MIVPVLGAEPPLSTSGGARLMDEEGGHTTGLSPKTNHEPQMANRRLKRLSRPLKHAG